MGSCLQDMLGKVTTIQEAKSVNMRYPNFITHKITQNPFQMEIIWTFSEFLWFWARCFIWQTEISMGTRWLCEKVHLVKLSKFPLWKDASKKQMNTLLISLKIAWRLRPRSPFFSPSTKIMTLLTRLKNYSWEKLLASKKPKTETSVNFFLASLVVHLLSWGKQFDVYIALSSSCFAGTPEEVYSSCLSFVHLA